MHLLHVFEHGLLEIAGLRLQHSTHQMVHELRIHDFII